MEYISTSEKETEKIAKEIFANSSYGDVFALSGDLGSGKTAFVKAFAKVSGVKRAVTSPTFVLLKQYPICQDNQKRYLVHIDCYRMESEQDAAVIGLEEYLKRKDVFVFIEWPERIQKLLPSTAKRISFEFINEKTRKIIIED